MRYGQRDEREQHAKADYQQDRDGKWRAGTATQWIPHPVEDEENQGLRGQEFREPAEREQWRSSSTVCRTKNLTLSHLNLPHRISDANLRIAK